MNENRGENPKLTLEEGDIYGCHRSVWVEEVGERTEGCDLLSFLGSSSLPEDLPSRTLAILRET